MKRMLIAALLVLTACLPAHAQTKPVSNVPPGDCSGTITTGGTAQNAIAASNSGRNGFVIANIDTTEVMWISFTGTAAAAALGSYPLAPATATTFATLSSFYSSIGYNTALSVVAATTGHKFTCTRW
jgi:hypothetical protein